MRTEEFVQMMNDMFLMDMHNPPPYFKHRESFELTSLQRWSCTEIIRAVRIAFNDNDEHAILEFYEVIHDFLNEMSTYANYRPMQRTPFSVARDVSINILDMLNAMM